MATHRRPDLLAVFLDCILGQLAQRPEFRLVVVNDGTHDAGYEAVVAPRRAAFTYLVLPENRGSGPARQAGCEGATEDYLVMTDDDCRPPAHWLDEILAFTMTYPGVDMFAGTTFHVDAPEGILTREIAHVANSTPTPVMNDSWLVTAVTANAIFRREMFERAGGFAPDIRMAAADDCCLTQRIIRAGGVWRLAPKIETGHYAIQSIRELWRKQQLYGRGTAQYVIRDQDWRIAFMHAPTMVGRMARGWRAGLMTWRQPENRRARGFRRFVRAALTFLAHLAYERGWRKGVKEFTKHYGRTVPAKPPLSLQYADFCSDIVLPAGRSSP